MPNTPQNSGATRKVTLRSHVPITVSLIGFFSLALQRHHQHTPNYPFPLRNDGCLAQKRTPAALWGGGPRCEEPARPEGSPAAGRDAAGTRRALQKPRERLVRGKAARPPRSHVTRRRRGDRARERHGLRAVGIPRRGGGGRGRQRRGRLGYRRRAAWAEGGAQPLRCRRPRAGAYGRGEGVSGLGRRPSASWGRRPRPEMAVRGAGLGGSRWGGWPREGLRLVPPLWLFLSRVVAVYPQSRSQENLNLGELPCYVKPQRLFKMVFAPLITNPRPYFNTRTNLKATGGL